MRDRQCLYDQEGLTDIKEECETLMVDCLYRRQADSTIWTPDTLEGHRENDHHPLVSV